MAGVADGLGDRLGGHRGSEEIDVNTWGHHVTQFELAELIDAFVDGVGFGRG